MSDFENNDDYFDEGEDFHDENGEGYYADDLLAESTVPAELMDEWKQAEIGIESYKLNQALLRQAISFLSKSWLWRFRSFKTKLKMLSDTYSVMSELTENKD